MRNILRRASAALGVFIGSSILPIACGGDGGSGPDEQQQMQQPPPPPPVVVASVDLTPGAPSVVVGGTVSLTATARDAAGGAVAGKSAAWAITPNGVAEVASAAGGAATLRGVAAGTATVRATVDAAFREVTLTVTPAPVTTTPLGALRSISAGDAYVCGLLPDGAAYCWGENGSGQLGDGTTTRRTTAVPVAGGLLFDVVAAGTTHTCGVTTGHRVYCWGSNTFGELGDGTTTARAAPTAVALPAGVDFRRVAVGRFHGCAATAAGAAYCWGYNGHGELGSGAPASSSPNPTPVAVAGGLQFASLVAGAVHTCGITTPARDTYCWGSNESGQLGDGTTTNRATPTALAAGTPRFWQLTAGLEHSCGLPDDTRIWCWGGNQSAQLGGATGTHSPTPFQMAGFAAGPAVRVTSGAASSHTCAIVTGGEAYCWGANGSAQLGNAAAATSAPPVRVSRGALYLEMVSAGRTHSCFLLLDGTPYCVGGNESGQLGDGTTTARTGLTRVLR